MLAGSWRLVKLRALELPRQSRAGLEFFRFPKKFQNFGGQIPERKDKRKNV